MRFRLPEQPDPFPAAFRSMLEQILRHARGMQGARVHSFRARHQALQQSGTFQGHRAYVQGDDLRRIDWNAYARTGSLFSKVLAEDEARAVTVMLDTSASMGVGSPSRWTTACRLAAILGGLSLAQLDAVTLVAGGETVHAGRQSLASLLERLVLLQPDGKAALPETPQRGAPLRVHWISDFVDPAAAERALHRLRRAGSRVTGWLPALRDDQQIEPSGWRLVCDPETGHEMPLRIDSELAAAMNRELLILQRQQEQAFSKCGFVLRRFHAPTDSFDPSAWMEAGWSFRR